MNFKRILTYLTVATAYVVIAFAPLLFLAGFSEKSSTDQAVVLVIGFLTFGIVLGGILAWTTYLDKKQGTTEPETDQIKEAFDGYFMIDVEPEEKRRRVARLRKVLIVPGILIGLFYLFLALAAKD